MAVTTLPTDLAAHVTAMRIITGLAGVEVGALPDQSHKSGGGYHCGCQDIIDIGRWGTAGSVKADYSVRQARDRIGANQCSAVDIGDNWPNGGRAAWLRFNNALLAALQARDPALTALRAINYSPDGVARKRYDTNNRGIVASTDSVDSHTHLEWWRDTVGTAERTAGLRRVEVIARAAISNQPSKGSAMSDWDTTFKPPEESESISLNAAVQRLYNAYYHGDMSGGYTANTFPNSLPAVVRRLEQRMVAQAAVIDALALAIKSGGGNVETAVILEAMDAKLTELAKEQRDAVADLGEGGSAQVRADA